MEAVKLPQDSVETSSSNGSNEFEASLAEKPMALPTLLRNPSSDSDDDGTLCAVSPDTSLRHHLTRSFTAKMSCLLTSEKRIKSRLSLEFLNGRLREIKRDSYQQSNACPVDPTSQWIGLNVRIKRENPEKLLCDRLAMSATVGGKRDKVNSAGRDVKGGDSSGEELLDVWSEKILLRSRRGCPLFDAVQPLLHRLGYRARPFSVTAGGFVASEAGPGSSMAASGKRGGKSNAAVVEVALVETIGSLVDRGLSQIFINFDLNAGL